MATRSIGGALPTLSAMEAAPSFLFAAGVRCFSGQPFTGDDRAEVSLVGQLLLSSENLVVEILGLSPESGGSGGNIFGLQDSGQGGGLLES